MKRIKRQAGFTIVETMVAASILMVGALGTLAMLDAVSKQSRTAANRQTGVGLVRDVVEAARQLPFRQVTSSTIVSRLQQNANLRGNGSTTKWQIKRGSATFTVTATVCGVDDPSDGSGSHAAGGFCPTSGATGTTDANPLDFKLITAKATWSENRKTKSVEEHVLMTSGGKDRPGVDTLTLTSPASPDITTPAITGASFRATTNITANALVWSIDGTQQGSAAGDGRTWNFNWVLPPVDGAYEVSAQAYDASGVSGTSRSVTINLNRYPPSAPEDFFAGRNGSVVELEWVPTPERDVIGYRVYRQQQNGAIQLACPLTDPEVSECVDTSPPAEVNQPLWYWVVGVDRDPAGAEREGSPSAKVNVNVSRPTAPAAPTDFAITEDDEGNVTLTWTPSATGADGYRIYRDGFTVGDRYGFVDTSDPDDIEFAFDDPDPGIDPHQYWITAVDSVLQESVLVGPVSLTVDPEPATEPVTP
jgi:type II secretory pathway pseudopilin PulG